ncbi:unnamed protein product, partial [Schistosoma turkestanicum]
SHNIMFSPLCDHSVHAKRLGELTTSCIDEVKEWMFERSNVFPDMNKDMELD